MTMKGFLEWRILAAVFAILIVLSSALTLNTGLKDFILGLGGNLGDLFRGSPLSPGISLAAGQIPVEIRLYGENITLSLDSPVNITSGGSAIENFRGSAIFNLTGRSSVLIPAGSDARITMETKDMLIRGVSIPLLRLSGIDFSVTSEQTNITTPKGDIEIQGFSGDMRASNFLMLFGNVTKVKDDKWVIG